jgi:hypothetical protein
MCHEVWVYLADMQSGHICPIAPVYILNVFATLRPRTLARWLLYTASVGRAIEAPTESEDPTDTYAHFHTSYTVEATKHTNHKHGGAHTPHMRSMCES